MVGQMLWFNEAKGYGFIRTEEDERLYVEADGFDAGVRPPARCAGMQVAFERDSGAAPPRAIGVTFPPEPQRQRARFRHRSGSMSLHRL